MVLNFNQIVIGYSTNFDVTIEPVHRVGMSSLKIKEFIAGLVFTFLPLQNAKESKHHARYSVVIKNHFGTISISPYSMNYVDAVFRNRTLPSICGDETYQ